MTEPTAPIHITYADALTRLQQAAEGREDHVYRAPSALGCVNLAYDESGKVVGSCIVGTAFAQDLIDFGVTPGVDGNAGGVYTMFTQILPADRYTITAKAYFLLENVQVKQDNGTPWGRAISETVATVSASSYDDVAPVRDFAAV